MDDPLCPDDRIFEWYMTKIKLMTLENTRPSKCGALKDILRETVRQLKELQEREEEDDCGRDRELCRDRCVPIGMCEVLGESEEPPIL